MYSPSSLHKAEIRHNPSSTKAMLSRVATTAPRRFSKLTDAVRGYDLNVNGVPRLPVPAVDVTMTRYLETMRPLLNEEDYKRTVMRRG